MGSLIAMAFLVIVSVVIVANTIKLTVFNREKEIGIMKYLGATDWFVRAPFIWGRYYTRYALRGLHSLRVLPT